MEDDQSINKTDDYDVVKMDNILDGNDPGYGLMHVDDDENSAPRKSMFRIRRNPTWDPSMGFVHLGRGHSSANNRYEYRC
ncbi:unnamed protein product [Adineta ricciae]|uniref:Uncharacterized protein n=1 Tax=Adineta ricciae TaxID=249248 RepID=A0A814PQP5_ADIRI|nr:unnamed protein product [Adineta ricciae]